MEIRTRNRKKASPLVQRQATKEIPRSTRFTNVAKRQGHRRFCGTVVGIRPSGFSDSLWISVFMLQDIKFAATLPTLQFLLWPVHCNFFLLLRQRSLRTWNKQLIGELSSKVDNTPADMWREIHHILAKRNLTKPEVDRWQLVKQTVAQLYWNQTAFCSFSIL